MKRLILRKDYYIKNHYTLPEAAERSDILIDDFLILAEQRDIRLWVVAHRWPIVWGDGSDFPSAPPIGIKKHIKQPFDYYYSGYLSLCGYDIRSLRTYKKCSLMKVHAEKDGQSFVGRIHWEGGMVYFLKLKFEFEIDNVFVSHEDLLRVENYEVGDWETEKEPTLMESNVAGQIAGKPTEARNARILREFRKLEKQNPGKNVSWIARIIAKNIDLNPEKLDWKTIRRIRYLK